jgi:hypothetical protein
MGTWADAGDPRKALERFVRFEAAVAPDVRVLCLAARLYRESGDPTRAEEVRARAERSAVTARDRDRLAEAGCR